MPGPSRAGRWRLHAALAVGLSLCTLGFTVELRRGMAGHLPAWVYVLEWPLFAVTGGVMWWRLLRDHDGQAARPTDDGPAASEPELLSWREYVARTESGDVDR